MRPLKIVLAIGAAVVVDGWSEPTPPPDTRQPLAYGMLPYQVLRRWGEPAEKQAFESKREEIWRYADARATFENGEVKNWRSAPPRQIRGPVEYNRESVPSSPKTGEARALLEDIFKSVPSETDEGSPQAPTRNPPG